MLKVNIIIDKAKISSSCERLGCNLTLYYDIIIIKLETVTYPTTYIDSLTNHGRPVSELLSQLNKLEIISDEPALA